jgi:hypothetical protein
VRRRKREKLDFDCVLARFIVLFAKCLCGMSGLEGVKLSFTPGSLLNLISIIKT